MSASLGTTGQPNGTGDDKIATRMTFARNTNPIPFASHAHAIDRRQSGARISASTPETMSQFRPVQVIVPGMTPCAAQE